MATAMTDMAHTGITAKARNTKLSRHGWFRRLQKPLVFLLLLLPFLSLVYSVLTNQVGANPIETITDITGEWSLRMLMLALALTPMRLLLKTTWPVRFRRMVGLFAFFYVCMHLLTYMVLDQQLNWGDILADVLERPFITAGTVAFLILLPLAITSTRRMVKRLGRRWQSLHRFVYIAGVAAVLHYIWLAKGDLVEPYVYLVLLIVLLLVRARHVFK